MGRNKADPIFAKKVGAILKSLRRSRHESQGNVAAALGLKQNSLSYYESGLGIPSLDFAAKLAQHYNVPLDYLVGAECQDKKNKTDSKTDSCDYDFDYEKVSLGRDCFWVHKVHVEVLEEFSSAFLDKKQLKIRETTLLPAANGFFEKTEEKVVYEDSLLEEMETSRLRKAHALKYGYQDLTEV